MHFVFCLSRHFQLHIVHFFQQSKLQEHEAKIGKKNSNKQQIKNILRMGSSKTKNWNNNDLYFINDLYFWRYPRYLQLQTIIKRLECFIENMNKIRPFLDWQPSKSKNIEQSKCNWFLKKMYYGIYNVCFYTW